MKNLFTTILSYIKENWKSGLAPFVSAILGGGIVALTGCTSAMPQSRGQSTEIVAVGIPAVAWISHSTQVDESSGSDTNATVQIKYEK